MNLSSLGLREQPFSQPVLPDRMFEHPEASEIRARIHEVVARRGGLVTVTGEPGVGKTTVLQWALSSVSPPNRVVFLPFPVAGEDLLRRVAEALGLPASGTPGSSVTLKVVRSALAAERDAGGCVIVAIDQAHRVTDETLIMLGLLMAPVRDHASLMPVILVAQPDLERRLARLRKAGAVLPAAVSCRLGPLSATQVRAYVDEHVRRAGGDPSSLFEPDVASRLVANTSGIPRLINTICTESLRAAAAAGRTRISGALINQVARLEETEATPVSVLAQVRETWSAWRRRVADARATRSRWRRRVRGRAPRSPGRQRVGRVRAALGAWRRPVGRVRAALSAWRPRWGECAWRWPRGGPGGAGACGAGRVAAAGGAGARGAGRVAAAGGAGARGAGRVAATGGASARGAGRVAATGGAGACGAERVAAPGGAGACGAGAGGGGRWGGCAWRWARGGDRWAGACGAGRVAAAGEAGARGAERVAAPGGAGACGAERVAAAGGAGACGAERVAAPGGAGACGAERVAAAGGAGAWR